VRTRIDTSANYRAVFSNGKTLRMRIDPTRPISVPAHPEIEDVAINSRCLANCPYCYTSATKNGQDFDRIVDKAHEVWGSLDPKERPFQIAIGGAGESTMHRDWPEFVRTVAELGIVPNYTTNGMHLTKRILRATQDHCGGVAVSYHPHIEPAFHRAISVLSGIDTQLNAHVIVGQSGSLDALKRLAERHWDSITHFVVLPYIAAGRATPVETDQEWRETFEWISKTEAPSRFAFGALFHPWLQLNEVPLDINTYEPEVLSGYRLMDDSYRLLRKSSYDLRPKLQ
jgi:MoaA/NifB/PqqE/SkfB family radical SAM enzyme